MSGRMTRQFLTGTFLGKLNGMFRHVNLFCCFRSSPSRTQTKYHSTMVAILDLPILRMAMVFGNQNSSELCPLPLTNNSFAQCPSGLVCLSHMICIFRTPTLPPTKAICIALTLHLKKESRKTFLLVTRPTSQCWLPETTIFVSFRKWNRLKRFFMILLTFLFHPETLYAMVDETC